jgi:hypothetical protein
MMERGASDDVLLLFHAGTSFAPSAVDETKISGVSPVAFL